MKISLRIPWLGRSAAAVQPPVSAPPAPKTPPPVSVPSVKLDPGPGLAHEVSRQVFQSFLRQIGSSSGTLTGLYNVETGQVLCGEGSHHELALKYGLEISPKPARLLPGWYGFRCFVIRSEGSFNISPESGLYGKLPAQHLPAFRAAMGELFAGNELFGKGTTYVTESAIAERRLAELHLHQASAPAERAAANPLSTLKRLGEAVAVATREEPNFENIAQALVDHCLVRLELGDQAEAIIADLTRSTPMKFQCNRGYLGVVLAWALAKAGLARKLDLLAPFLKAEVLGQIFGISDK